MVRIWMRRYFWFQPGDSQKPAETTEGRLDRSKIHHGSGVPGRGDESCLP